MTEGPPAWIADLEADAPDVVACWRAADGTFEGLTGLRRELRNRVDAGSAPRILAQQEAIGDALESALTALPPSALEAPGGEEDWNVAQAFAHTTAARRFLATWASWDAAGMWPEQRPPVVTPSIPGPPAAEAGQLLTLLEKSRVAIRQAAGRIAGHELDRCLLDHPLVGRLRCGEWLLFIGVHDLMHLEQLNRLRGSLQEDGGG